MSKFVQVGSIKESQKGNEYINLNLGYDSEKKTRTDEYLRKLHSALTQFIKKPDKTGINLMLQAPEERLEKAVQNGKLSEERAQEYKSKIPSYIKKEIFLVLEDDSDL